MGRRVFRQIIAAALGGALLVTGIPVISGQDNIVEAEAASSNISVTFTDVHVNQDKAAAAYRQLTTQAASTSAGRGSNTTTTPASVNYDSTLEKYAIERAKDIIILNDSTRPDGTSGSLITSSGYSGSYINYDSELRYVGASSTGTSGTTTTTRSGSTRSQTAGTGPSWTSADIPDGSHSVGIGVVTYQGNDYYVAVFSSGTGDGRPCDRTRTGFVDVTRDVNTSYIRSVSATYTYTGLEKTQTFAADGSAAAADTFSMKYGDTEQIPQIVYTVSTQQAAQQSRSTSGRSQTTAQTSAPTGFPLTVAPVTTVTSNDTSMLAVSGNNITALKAGTGAGITISAVVAGEYTQLTVPVTVDSLPLTAANGITISLKDPTTRIVADGKAKTPDVVLTRRDNGTVTTLSPDDDYTVAYTDNTAAADIKTAQTATVTATGKGNYSGTISTTFRIQPVDSTSADTDKDNTGKDNTGGDTPITSTDISKATAEFTNGPFVYNGQRQIPVFILRIGTTALRPGTDYDSNIIYPDSTDAGTYSFTVTGRGDYAGTDASSPATLTVTYTIQQKNAQDLYGETNGITVTKLSQKTFNGKSQKPSVTVYDESITPTKKLTSGTDYTRTDSSNKYPGTARVTLSFEGNYTGTIDLTYRIVPKKTTLKKVSAGRRQAKVTYSKVSGISGYQVKSGTNKSVTKGTKTKNTTKTTYTMKSLSRGKRYYFKVRTYYSGTNGKKTYSAWSNVRSVVVR